MSGSTTLEKPITGRTEEDQGLILGRPLEDRSFEAVEAAAGLALGMAVGTAVAGPVGTVLGGVAGATLGLVAGEALERAEGRAATTTDAAAGEAPFPEG
jgi:hypothetical protein